jgi:drug/metabolite transporter (DMT)-like permease
VIDFRFQRYALLALASAALFGAATPAVKPLTAALHPVLLAGLLYLGSFFGLGLARLARGKSGEAPLVRRDLGALLGAVLAGGLLAPVLLVWGLSGLAASSASLLLAAEAVLGAGALLAWAPQLALAFSPHALAVFGACLLWALDNNLTRRISLADPYAIAMWKGLVAGAVNTALGLALAPVAPQGAWLAALGVGALGYGASLVLYVLAMRHLGAARTAAHFGTAPFFGAVLSLGFLGEPVTPALIGGFALTLAGTWLALTERHEHTHQHEALEHEHRHVHDAHHQHPHRGDEGPEPHSHAHRHQPMRHSHPHFPEVHHPHRH